MLLPGITGEDFVMLGSATFAVLLRLGLQDRDRSDTGDPHVCDLATDAMEWVSHVSDSDRFARVGDASRWLMAPAIEIPSNPCTRGRLG